MRFTVIIMYGRTLACWIQRWSLASFQCIRVKLSGLDLEIRPSNFHGTPLTRYTFRYMMIKGNPCKVVSISVSKTGKHGHAKCNFVATDIFTGKKYEDMIPSTHGTTVPIVNKSEWEVIDIEGEELTLMDEGGNQKTDLNLPSYPEKLADEIREAWAGGEGQVAVTVQSAVGIEQIIGFKKITN